MKSLGKWQFISMVSRFFAIGIGLITTVVIARVFTVAEFGLYQIALSIGGALGIYQHLGLSSGSTREISSAKSKKEIFQIFFTSLTIRYLVVIPIAVGLYYYSDVLAAEYENPALILPLRLYAIALIAQGAQGILNSIIAGMKRFKTLFIYQPIIALLNVSIFVPFVYYYKVNGYFLAFAIFNFLAAIVLAFIAFAPLRGHMSFPNWKEYKKLLRELFSISLGIYAVKVILTQWEKLGPIVLGFSVSVETVGIFGMAILFAKKITHLSDAVTDVNLPVFSDKYVNDLKGYKKLFVENFNKIFAFILFSSTTALFWSSELIDLIAGKGKFSASYPLIFPLMFTFVFYSLINIIKSSVFVPAKYVIEMVFGYVLLLFGTLLSYYMLVYYFGYSHLFSMSAGMLVGAITSLTYLVLLSQYKLKFKYLTHDHVLILVQVFVIGLSKDLDNFWLKAGTFILFMLLYIWSLFVTKMITKSDVNFVLTKVRRNG